ncbi:deoxyuridine 5'-triphosphate hypothetical protein [Enterococcus phage TJE1]|uniref:EF-hand domain-containing protein n=1 Tax=Enterococcus phage TJE1 TaxID=2951262 RepID=A0A976SXP2_9CAUD|nr:deoxyuridine 5'-triphosphate hypothetical protein [Enterococcus phage TJE1]
MKIYVAIDEYNVLTGWSSTYEKNLIETEIDENHPLVVSNDFFGNYKLVNGKLTKDTAIELLNLKDMLKVELDQQCMEAILDGFNYPLTNSETLHVSYSRNKQQYFEEIKSLFERKIVTRINWEFITEDGTAVTKELDEVEFLTLYTFASLVKKAKMSKLKEKLYPLVDKQSSKEDLLNISWESIPDEPLPDKPVIDLNGDGEISQDEFDALVKENKELKQKVEFNEMALMDAINMLSSMIMS